jgi:hypothetical protein
LRRHIEGLEVSAKARFETASKNGKVSRKEFFDGAKSWNRVECNIARVRGRRGRTRYTLHRHEPEGSQRSCAL